MGDETGVESGLFRRIINRLSPLRGTKISNIRNQPDQQQPDQQLQEGQAPNEPERPEKLWGYTSIHAEDPTGILVMSLKDRGLDIRIDSTKPKLKDGKRIEGQEVAIYGTPEACKVLSELRQTPEFRVIEYIVGSNYSFGTWSHALLDLPRERAIRDSGWDSATKQEALVLFLSAQISGSRKYIRRYHPPGDQQQLAGHYIANTESRIAEILGQGSTTPKVDEHTIRPLVEKVIDIKLPTKAPH